MLNLPPVSPLYVPESLHLEHQIKVLCCCFLVNGCTLIANRSDHGQAVGRQGAFILPLFTKSKDIQRPAPQPLQGTKQAKHRLNGPTRHFEFQGLAGSSISGTENEQLRGQYT